MVVLRVRAEAVRAPARAAEFVEVAVRKARPHSMIPNTSSMRRGMTMAASTIAAPSSPWARRGAGPRAVLGVSEPNICTT